MRAQESDSAYRLGGYHPVRPGDVYNNCYCVEDKLGYGAFSTVWRCWDKKRERFVATKISKSALVYTNTAKYERRVRVIVHSSKYHLYTFVAANRHSTFDG